MKGSWTKRFEGSFDSLLVGTSNAKPRSRTLAHAEPAGMVLAGRGEEEEVRTALVSLHLRSASPVLVSAQSVHCISPIF